MKKIKLSILAAIVILLSSCASFGVAALSGRNMNNLELGMTKEQVTQILGSNYSIAEKRIEENNLIEVLSYQDYYSKQEYYMFVLKNNKLEKWYRILQPITLEAKAKE